MSDPSERNKADPHPLSSHRTPSEIAEDEAGPIGGHPYHHDAASRANNGPIEKLTKGNEVAEAPNQNPPSTRGVT